MVAKRATPFLALLPLMLLGQVNLPFSGPQGGAAVHPVLQERFAPHRGAGLPVRPHHLAAAPTNQAAPYGFESRSAWPLVKSTGTELCS